MKLLSSGWRGEVYIMEENNIKYAIKKAKDYSKKASIQREVEILKKLKGKIDFIPQIEDYGENWFKYKFIEGITLDKLKEIDINIFIQLIEYAFELDKLNIEHGELSRPTKNIIINKGKVYIIDFERGNIMNKNFKNLKAIGQFLASKKIISNEELKKLFKIDKGELIKNTLLSKLKSNYNS